MCWQLNPVVNNVKLVDDQSEDGILVGKSNCVDEKGKEFGWVSLYKVLLQGATGTAKVKEEL